MTKSLLDNNNVRTPSEDYLSYLIQLSEQERKDVYQEVMKDRTDRLSDRLENQTLGQILGGGINLSERIISGLGGSGFDKIPVFKGTSEEKAFIKAAKDILDNRETKFSGGLLDDDMSRLRLAEGTKEGKLPIFNELETEILRDTYKQLMPYDDRQRQYMADLVRDNPEMSGFPEQYADMDRFLDNKKILLHALENRLLKTNGGLLGDLNKDGKMSDYEQARQDAIEKNMKKPREGFPIGGLARAAAKQIEKLFRPKRTQKEYWDGLREDYLKLSDSEKDALFKKFNASMEENSTVKLSDREFDMIMWNEVGEEATDFKPYYQMPEEYLVEKGFYRKPNFSGGLLEDDMNKLALAEGGEMLPDEMMEQNFVDFVVDEALSPEEKSMLEEQLEANPQLSVLFDKVVETASEFTGAGPVEGPGTGTSDDIPARLSDGEFVFTAKAVEQLGADNLMKMMKDAEAAYDAGGEREAMQEGGLTSVEEEEENPMMPKQVEVTYNVNKSSDVVSGVNPVQAAQEEQDMVDEELKKRMMGITPYVRS